CRLHAVLYIMFHITLFFPPYLFFYCYRDHPDLHSFPTRRSSDLLEESTGATALFATSCAGDINTGHALDGRPDDPHRRTFARCRSEEHTSELQSRFDLVCRLLLEKKNKTRIQRIGRVHTIASYLS